MAFGRPAALGIPASYHDLKCHDHQDQYDHQGLHDHQGQHDQGS